MRKVAPRLVLLLAVPLAACGGAVGHDFETDFKAAKANAATLKGGAFDHAVGQRLLTPDTAAAVQQCAARHAPERETYRGVMAFDGSRGYRLRFEADDDFADCLVGVLEGREMPEPPERPYLMPVELAGKAK